MHHSIIICIYDYVCTVHNTYTHNYNILLFFVRSPLQILVQYYIDDNVCCMCNLRYYNLLYNYNT